MIRLIYAYLVCFVTIGYSLVRIFEILEDYRDPTQRVAEVASIALVVLLVHAGIIWRENRRATTDRPQV
jgi:prolipoprotein diacylglyceryltransferase